MQNEVRRASPRADPDAAARKLIEIASTIEPVQDGRIYVELVNALFLQAGGSPDLCMLDSHAGADWREVARHENRCCSVV